MKQRFQKLTSLMIFLTVKLFLVIFFIYPGFAQTTFVDFSEQARIGNIGNGMGVCSGDYDKDGYLDIYVANDGQNVLYHNNGDGSFDNVTNQAGVGDTGYGVAARFGDYDNDGYLDLYVINNGQTNTLYRNNGNGTFTDVTSQAGVGNAGLDFDACFVDYDNDGYLDIYVVGMKHSVLYHNNGNGTFTDVTKDAGVENPNNNGAAVICGDYDNDGDSDLYVVNKSQANVLYRNNGDGTFTDVTFQAVVGDSGFGVDANFSDYDNDGDLDIYVVNISGANVLYRNNGNGTFTNVTKDAGVEEIGNGRAAVFGDYDNDGDLDLCVVNWLRKPTLYRNDGNGKFTDVTGNTGFNDTRHGTNAMFGDYDGDGDLDLYIVNWQEANALYHNEGTVYNGVNVQLVGRVSNRDGIGAIVTVESNAGTQWNSFTSSPVHFGLGAATHINRMRIQWPSGIGQTFENISLDNSQQNGGLRLDVGKHLITVEEPIFVFPDSLSPPANAQNVGKTTTISTRFDEPIADFIVKGSQSGRHAGEITYVGDTATFVPVTPFISGKTVFISGETVTVTVTHDKKNSPNIFPNSFNWSFRIRNGSGPFSFGSFETKLKGEKPVACYSANLDGDGDIDLAVANNSSQNISILKNNGSGSFDSVELLDMATPATAIYAVDIDDKQGMDIIATSGSEIFVFLNDGKAHFGTPLIINTGDGNLAELCGADMDGDGDIDIAAVDEASSSIIILLNEKNSFTPLNPLNVKGSAPKSICSGDFDGDGDIDLATANSGSNDVSIVLNKGTARLSVTARVAVGLEPRSICAADLDGDGNLDLATANSRSNSVSVLLNRGHGRFEVSNVFDVGSEPRALTAVDINGDGLLDLATANRFSGDVSVLLNKGDANFDVAKTLHIGGKVPNAISAADFDGDGDIDFFTANEQSNDVSILFNIAPPEINENGINPKEGGVEGEEEITIGGSGFIKKGNTFSKDTEVTIGGRLATIVKISNTSITVNTPKGAPGPNDVTVTNPDGQSDTIKNGFTYYIITGAKDITPNNGPLKGGIIATITGRNFIEGVTVSIGGKEAEVIQIAPDSHSIIVNIPSSQTPGAKDVTVKNPGGEEEKIHGGFKYNPFPTIHNINPQSVPYPFFDEGKEAEISGEIFIEDIPVVQDISGEPFIERATVAIGGKVAQIKSVSTNTIKIIIPLESKAPGAKDVTVTNPDGQSDTLHNGFSYHPQPKVTKIVPAHGPLAGGTPIVIEGEHFFLNRDEGELRVTIGGRLASNVTLKSETTLIARTPPSTTEGPQDVKVKNPDDQQSSEKISFNYIQDGFAYNFPNPFSAAEGTTFRYVTTKTIVRMKVSVYTLAGFVVDVLQSPNTELKWENERVRNLNAGLYVSVIEVEFPDGHKVSQQRLLEVYR